MTQERAPWEEEVAPWEAASPVVAPTPKKAEKSALWKAGNLAHEYINKPVWALAETGSQLATAVPAQIVGGLRGIGSLLAGEGVDAAARKVTATTEGMTYAPRTKMGQDVSAAVAYPFQKLAEGSAAVGGAVGEAVGGEKGRLVGESIGEVAPDVAGTLLGGKASLRKARDAAIRPTVESVRQTYPDYVPPSELKAKADVTPKLRAAEAAQRQGLAIDMPDLDPSIKGKILRKVATANQIQEAMEKANLGKPEQALKRQVGIATEKPLSLEELAIRREELAGPKNQIMSMEGFVDDGQAVAEISKLIPKKTVGMGKEYSTAVGEVARIVDDIQQGSGRGDWVMSSIESLRKAARDIHGRNDITPELRNTADIYKGTANALEGIIERKLAKDNPDLLGQYRQNRKSMAQTYLLEDLLDENTGKVNLQKLANMTANDEGVTGAFQDVGKAYAHSPESFKKLPKEDMETRISRWTIPGAIGAALGTGVAPGLGTFGGAAVGVGAQRLLGGKAARILANRPAQSRYLKGLGREQMGYGAPEPVAPPLSLAPEGELLIPPSPSMPMPEGRGLLSLADETVAALRQPEMQGVDFPLEGRNVPLYQRGGLPEEPRLSGPAAAQGGIAYEPGLPEVPAGLSKAVEGMPELPPSDIPANPLYGFRELSEGRGAAQPLPTLPPLERGLLDFADEPSMTVQALRGVPEEKMNFPLRQEVMDDLAPVTDPLRQQLNDLYALRDRQSGFWKQQTQAQIDELEKYFRAGLRQVGIDTPVDAWGQAMYGSGQPTKLPIEKTFTLEALRGVK